MTSRRRRRNSIDHPPNISDFTPLNEELNRLHTDILHEYKKHLKKVCDVLDDFRKDQLDIYLFIGGIITAAIAMMFSILSFRLDDADDSLIFAGAGLTVSVVAVVCVAFGLFKKTQKGKRLKQSVNEELKQFQDKMNPTIEKMEQICQRIEKILKHPLLLDYNVSFIDHFSHSFETPIFQKDFSNMGDLKLSKILDLPRKISEIITKVSSVPYMLQEIIEENKRRKDKAAKTALTEFKEKAEKFINDMQKEIAQLKKILNEVNRINDKISNLFK